MVTRHRDALADESSLRKLPNQCLSKHQGNYSLNSKPCHREVDRPLNESAVPPRGRTALEPVRVYYNQSCLFPSPFRVEEKTRYADLTWTLLQVKVLTSSPSSLAREGSFDLSSLRGLHP
jgi:hypothetical protein